MKAYIFDSLWSSLVSDVNLKQLKGAGVDVINIEAGSLSDYTAIFSDVTNKIVVINPDFVGWKLPGQAFENIQNLKCLITQSTSYGWIDTEAARSRKIPVCNIRNFSTDAVAEWATMMMLNLARKIPRIIKDGFPLNYESDYKTYQGINLIGKTAGIIGLGNIGKAIAERCVGLGMRIVYWSQTSKDTAYSYQDLQSVMAEADVIFPCIADCDGTHDLIPDSVLSTMKSKAIFVSIVHQYNNHPFILKMIKDNQLFGYGFEADPAVFNSYEGNIWAAPEYAWCTDGSMRNSMDLSVEAIINAAQGRYPTQVN